MLSPISGVDPGHWATTTWVGGNLKYIGRIVGTNGWVGDSTGQAHRLLRHPRPFQDPRCISALPYTPTVVHTNVGTSYAIRMGFVVTQTEPCLTCLSWLRIITATVAQLLILSACVPDRTARKYRHSLQCSRLVATEAASHISSAAPQYAHNVRQPHILATESTTCPPKASTSRALHASSSSSSPT